MWSLIAVNSGSTDQFPAVDPGIIRPLVASASVANHRIMWHDCETGTCEQRIGLCGSQKLNGHIEFLSSKGGAEKVGQSNKQLHFLPSGHNEEQLRKQGGEISPDRWRRKKTFWLKLSGRGNCRSCEIFHAFVDSWDSVPQGSTAQMSKTSREKGCSFHVQTEITLKLSVPRASQTVCMVRAY